VPNRFVVAGDPLRWGKQVLYLTPPDMIVPMTAGRVGFKVDKGVVARTLERRLPGNHFLREAIVALRKPDG
jgi:hypothetical protein